MLDLVESVEARLPSLGRSVAAMGRAAEMSLAAMLIERGFSVAVPLVDDDGVDLVVDYRLKVQVKSSGIHDLHSRSERFRGRYRYFVFHCRKPGCATTRPDVWALQGVSKEGRWWWFVPDAAIGETQTISLLPPGVDCGHLRETKSRAMERYLDAWGVFADG